jgi:putative ABC transport system permease protein
MLDNIRSAISGLKTSKMRAFLTVLGIIIGISSVILITALGGMIQGAFTSLIDDIGISNMVEIALSVRDEAPAWDGSMSDTDLITDDVLAAVEARFGSRIAALGLQEYVGDCAVTDPADRSETLPGYIIGYNRDGIETSGNKLVAGHFISEADNEKIRYTANIPENFAEKLFGSAEAAIGQPLTLRMTNRASSSDTYDFTITGVYKSSNIEIGGSLYEVYDVAIPITTARFLLGTDPKNGTYQYFFLNAADNEDPDLLLSEVKTFLNNGYYKNNPIFNVDGYSAKEQMESINSAIAVVAVILGLIAGIALIVGGIGVMNIMLVSVTERTREIGIRKALGATNGAVRSQFLTESVIICTLGGILGILWGYIISTIIAAVGNTLIAEQIEGLVLQATISTTAVAVSVLFSMAIGVFFGSYPANKAAKLLPIEALRFE